jgi:hypothetical protein
VNLSDFFGDLVGVGFVLVFLVLMVTFTILARQRPRRTYLRDISAFTKLRQGIGLAVEAGQRLHISLGHGGINGSRGASALVGLSMLQRIARAASISDRPPVATSGEATTAVLSQDTLRSIYRSIGASEQYDPDSSQLSGLTPFSYAVGAIPVIYDQQVSVNILAGHFGSEIALITDAAERCGGLSLAGSDNISGQAVLYACAQEPLIGEELFVGGAYIRVNPMHIASLHAQDIMRWVLIGFILVGALVKLF